MKYCFRQWAVNNFTSLFKTLGIWYLKYSFYKFSTIHFDQNLPDFQKYYDFIYDNNVNYRKIVLGDD